MNNKPPVNVTVIVQEPKQPERPLLLVLAKWFGIVLLVLMAMRLCAWLMAFSAPQVIGG